MIGVAQSLAGPVYVDASILLKLFFPEADSASVERMLIGRRDLIASNLAVTEVVSALSRRRREGAISSPAVARLYQKILNEFDSGTFLRVDPTPETHRLAERLLLAMESNALRASDALHLALAVSAGAQTICTTDRRMAEAARSSGFTVHP